MTVYNSRFDLAAVGNFTHANKLLAWPGASVPLSGDQDQAGNIESILHSGGPNGEAICRYLYPLGKVGAPGRSYVVSCGNGGFEVTLSLDVMFEDHTRSDNGKDFDLYGAALQSHNGGKVPGAIQWGPIAGARGGVRAMTWWQTNAVSGSRPAKKHNPVLQNQQTIPTPSPNELIQPVVYSTVLTPGVWHNHEKTLKVTANGQGYYRNKIDGVLICNYTGPMSGAVPLDAVVADMVGFAGGGSPAADSPLWDSWVRIANVVITIADDVMAPPPGPKPIVSATIEEV